MSTNPKWRRGLDASLENTSIDNGNILVTVDTNRLLIDIDDNRIEITDFIRSTEAEILATLTPLPKFYFAADTGYLYYYSGGWKSITVDIAKRIIATSNNTTKAYLVGVAGTSDGQEPIYDPDVYIDISFGALRVTTINGFALADACAKSVSDSTSANAITNTDTSLVTERDVYNGLPNINGVHNYTSNTNIYAPTSVGAANQFVVSNGSGAPVWLSPVSVLSKLGCVYGTCSTTYATSAKEVAISNYELTQGGVVTVTFSEKVNAGATLNINGKGAKPIYHLGSAIKDSVIRAGATALFVYSGSYYILIGIDTDVGDDYGDEDEE